MRFNSILVTSWAPGGKLEVHGNTDRLRGVAFVVVSDGDGSNAKHRLIGQPVRMVGLGPCEVWVDSVPALWIDALARGPLYLFPVVNTLARGPLYLFPVCECGVDKAGVGGLHSDWCPKAVR